MQQQQQWLVSHITEYTSDTLAVSLHMKDHISSVTHNIHKI